MGGIAGADSQQESWGYYSHSLIVMSRIAASPAAPIAVRGKAFGRGKAGWSSGGARREISGLVSGMGGGEAADESAALVF